MQTESSSVIIESSHVSDCEKMKRQRKVGITWTEEEDRMLLKAVEALGTKQWVEVAKLVGTRSRKQCRERYVNHICPNIDKRPFTHYEDKIICNSFYVLGKKWSKIAESLSGRTARSIRNRFKTIGANQKISCFYAADKNNYAVVSGGKLW
ncbi:trichome differentiation protein GL1, putative [Entamoeba invadens IP1]|uniref:Trichome differentiation protein GL1, putative n=1 Tax=Entamoeba invadens IP1 TaxID=370355 RepID=A0A0A1U7V3_ENTIV|nr:trichome differentiation protein GL1, putative [Entamoeba invadens IP1]ELP90870.1 trichome differentiation protein GL1, putative [Entamoeba invadens IP1]|eukprot:XP_004257641.1 trichome differentiation protein GL1, putative [Entamoeba invadens IP1]